jgi:hypothetical protein
MRKTTQKEIKKELIKIINNSKIDEVIYEPRYMIGYELQRAILGSTITLRTTLKK